MAALVHLSDSDSFPLILLQSIGCGAFPTCKNPHGVLLNGESYWGDIVAGTAAAAYFFYGASLATLWDAADSLRVAAAAIGSLPR